MHSRMIMTVCAVAFLVGTVSQAAVPTSITVQGRVTDASDNPLPAGAKSFVFRIFNASVGGTELWPGGAGETQTITTSSDGLWIGLVGAINPLTDAVFSDTTRWLQITVSGTTLPRVRLVSEPYAFRVATVDGASGGNITNKLSIGSSINPGNHAFAAGFSNVASGQSTVSLGSSNSASGGFSSVLGGNSNQVSGEFGVIAGGYNNSVGDSAGVVNGGMNNFARGRYSVVAGGGGINFADSNSAVGYLSTIGGGRRNVASGDTSSIGGGIRNTASGRASVVAGGKNNVASGNFATVAGGLFHSAIGAGTVVSGGTGNEATAAYATISGGYYSEASGGYSTVGGGDDNAALSLWATVAGGRYNRADGSESFIGGGRSNRTSGNISSVMGGLGNTASGYCSAIIGGWLNTASGSNSAAAGRRANAAHAGTFVWADETDADFSSSGTNQFLIRASGGVGIGTNAPEKAMQVQDDSSGGLAYALKLSNESPATNGTTTGILFQVDDGPARGKGGLVYEGTTTWNRGDFHFLQNAVAGDPVNAGLSDKVFTIRNDGNVGIKNSSPGNILTVQQNSATDPVADAWTTYSSRRWKKNISPLKDALEKVQRLQGVEYDWKQNDQHDIGLIAEEVGKVIPEVVAYEENGIDAKSVDYARLTALLIEGMKEQQLTIQGQQQQIDVLKSRLDQQLP